MPFLLGTVMMLGFRTRSLKGLVQLHRGVVFHAQVVRAGNLVHEHQGACGTHLGYVDGAVLLHDVMCMRQRARETLVGVCLRDRRLPTYVSFFIVTLYSQSTTGKFKGPFSGFGFHYLQTTS